MKQNNVNVEIIPCPAFTGDNLDFFEQYIYTCKEDITVCSYDKKIFCASGDEFKLLGQIVGIP